MSKKDDYFDIHHFSEQESSEFTLKCRSCGKILVGGEGYYQSDGEPHCEDCVESADLEDLVRICETSTENIYRLIGLSHQFVLGDAE